MNDNTKPEIESAPEIISRELQAARKEIREVQQREEDLRKDIAEDAARYIVGLDQAASEASEQLLAEQNVRSMKLEELKQKLDASVASGDNDGMMALLDEIAQLEIGGDQAS